MTDPVSDRTRQPIHPGAVSGHSDPDRIRSRRPADPQRLDAACREMESLFLNQLFKEMRATIPDSGLLSGGPGKDIYTSLMDSHLAADISSKGGIGLARVLKAQLAGGDRQTAMENNAQESRGLADDPIE